MLVDMKSPFGCLYSQQHEFAIVFIAVETNSAKFIAATFDFALVSTSKCVHRVKVRECLKELPS
jgi:hypothetical protein